MHISSSSVTSLLTQNETCLGCTACTKSCMTCSFQDRRSMMLVTRNFFFFFFVLMATTVSILSDISRGNRTISNIPHFKPVYIFSYNFSISHIQYVLNISFLYCFKLYLHLYFALTLLNPLAKPLIRYINLYIPSIKKISEHLLINSGESFPHRTIWQ